MAGWTMREYKIKRGHNPDISALIKEYFGAEGDILKGMIFEVEGIGKIGIKQEKSSLIVDIEPPKKISSDYSVVKKWNDFLLDATGKTSKERKKEFGKIK
jgi:hypothetical protein